MAQGSSWSGRLGTVVAGVVMLALIAGFGYLLLQAIDGAPEVVGAFVTALGAVVAVVYGRAWEKSRELEQSRRERIAPTYSRMVEAFYGSMGDDATHTEADLIGAFQEWAHKALLWAPAPVIQAFNEWRAMLPDGDELPGPEAGIGFERLLFAFREDLGNKRGDLKEGDLLRVFINDIDDYLLAYRLQQAERSLPSADDIGEE
jgi:hypothetical protein